MLTKTLYHGTKHDVDEVMNNPRMGHSANGYGLYLTDNITIACMYGSVIAFEVPYDFEVDVMRPMDLGEDIGNHNATELVINTQATWVKFMKTMEDVYPEPYATPF